MKQVDVAVVGGAAAGLTAALFAARRGLITAIVTKDIGGQLAATVDVANYPGIPYIEGFVLARRMADQATAAGAELIMDEVVTLAATAGGITVTGRNNKLAARALIIALGKAPRSLNVPGERELLGRGVYHAAAGVIERYNEQPVAVIGGGSSAFTTAKLAAGHAAAIHLIHRSDQYRAEAVLIDEVWRSPAVQPHPFTEVGRFNGTERLESLVLKDTRTGQEEVLPATAAFINVGYEVQPALFADLVALDAQRRIVVDARGATSRPGVFAAGDITNRAYNQIAISVGEGATAALAAYSYLTGKPAGADWGLQKRVS